MRKKTGCWLALAVVVVLVAGGIGLAIMRLGTNVDTQKAPEQRVLRGDLEIKVIESGSVDAARVVEVRSRVSGRVARLLVDAGDTVSRGQLIAVIDPQETELRVEQDRANLRGAQSAVARVSIEIEQSRVAARARVDQARARVAQLEQEVKAQPELTRSGIASARAAANAARQALDQLVQTTQPNEKTAAETTLGDAESQLLNAEREATRRADLLARGFVSEREKQAADLDLSLARTRLQAARDRMDRLPAQQDLERRQAEERLRQAESDLRRAEAGAFQDDVKAQELLSALAALRDAQAGLTDVEALQASKSQNQAQVDQISSVLRDSERQLGETEIRAPIDGVVTRKLVQEGELVASLSSFSAGTPIVRIEDRSAMLVKLNINEIDVAKLKLGTPAEIVVDALPGKTFRGQVSKIAPSSTAAGQPGTGGGADPVVRYAIEVQLIDPDPNVKSGMTAKCTMIVTRKEDVLLLPIDFVGKDDVGSFVMALPAGDDGDGKGQRAAEPSRRAVVVGTESGAQVEIVSGIEEGAVVVRPTFTGPPRRGMQLGNEG